MPPGIAKPTNEAIHGCTKQRRRRRVRYRTGVAVRKMFLKQQLPPDYAALLCALSRLR
jgi:hypothetical protein